MTIIADENATEEDEDATDDAGRNIFVASSVAAAETTSVRRRILGFRFGG